MEEIGKAKVDVVALQEIRWQDQGRIDKKRVDPKRGQVDVGQDLL